MHIYTLKNDDVRMSEYKMKKQPATTTTKYSPARRRKFVGNSCMSQPENHFKPKPLESQRNLLSFVFLRIAISYNCSRFCALLTFFFCWQAFHINPHCRFSFPTCSVSLSLFRSLRPVPFPLAVTRNRYINRNLVNCVKAIHVIFYRHMPMKVIRHVKYPVCFVCIHHYLGYLLFFL